METQKKLEVWFNFHWNHWICRRILLIQIVGPALLKSQIKDE